MGTTLGNDGNTKVYIHELIEIEGHNRARYQHHMTANWCPVARQERRQLCFGVWSTVGSTGRWPEVVNLWEIDGWDGMAHDLGHELGGGRDQDPSLEAWWAVAASFRRGGFDRILVPEPWSPTIGEHCSAGRRGEVYLHELVTLPAGAAPAFLTEVVDEAVPAYGDLGAVPIGAFRVAMVADTEAVLIWALPHLDAWVELEQAWLTAHHDGPLVHWRKTALGHGASWRRTLMVDAPLSPLRIGRQPTEDDRLPLDEV